MLTRSAEWVGCQPTGLDDSASEGLKRANTTVSLNWGIPTIPVQAFQADEDILDHETCRQTEKRREIVGSRG